MAEVRMSTINILLLHISRAMSCLPVQRNKMLSEILASKMHSPVAWMSDSVSQDARPGIKTLCEVMCR